MASLVLFLRYAIRTFRRMMLMMHEMLPRQKRPHKDSFSPFFRASRMTIGSGSNKISKSLTEFKQPLAM